MISKTLKTTLAAALVLTSMTAPVFADNLGAAIVGGLIGGVIVNEANKNKRRTYTNNANSVTRQQNREVQTSLNYFGFPAGTADGVMGSRSRQAVANYQAFMGYPATGQLTQYERDFLVSSYNRAQIGGPQVIKAMQGPQGVRGVLIVWRDEAQGTRTAGYSTGYGGLPIEVSNAIDEIASSTEPSAEQLMQRSGFMQLADMNNDGKNDYILDTSVSGSSFWCGASHCTVMVFASAPEGYRRIDFQARGVTPASFSCHLTTCSLREQGTMTAAAPAQPAPMQPAAPSTVMASGQSGGMATIKPFNMAPSEPPQASLASHCSKVSLLTNSNGGFMTVSNLRDPDLALSEQFCLTRTYAIGTGEAMAAKVQGASQAQIDTQCDAFGPALQPYVDSLGSSDAMSLKGDVQKFVLGSNMSIQQLAATARICLYSGYRRDKMDVALGSALLMVGVGQTPYAELVGHHLSQGFGAPQSAQLAQPWYDMALQALDSGVEPVFAPGQPERMDVIRAASAALNGGGLPTASPASTLPTFKME
ncbi:peptidoglycan-binding protein [Thalassobius vesicularis]|uniref:Peptidoglycan-binding protein n=1 Tax=Thalassobius vesicularis TaxID=1294297 RepID=A0A4S3MDM5_9RHOB|nr:peptidoglycan-binding domain-containing protein [Thalassobius vesicularis]THD75618.1 peptidoglycan-binding protein [Thalassobius vesicularis]